MPAELRRYYKRSRKLILTRHYKLSDDNKKALEIMLLYNDDLRLAHHLKEWFYEICQSNDYDKQIKEFNNWIKDASSSELRNLNNVLRHISIGIMKYLMPLNLDIQMVQLKALTTELKH